MRGLTRGTVRKVFWRPVVLEGHVLGLSDGDGKASIRRVKGIKIRPARNITVAKEGFVVCRLLEVGHAKADVPVKGHRHEGETDGSVGLQGH